MFRQKNTDVKKSTAKIQDPKKDIATRVKHLRIILDNVDLAEAKGVFEANCSHIYHILYDSFIQAESNLRQRELSFHLVHKAHKEEFECTLWILEQVLSLLPELINRRWQLHSLGRLLSKLLHQGNSVKLRRQAIRYFLMWYQALNENAPQHVHDMFASLVPSVNVNSVLPGLTSVFHDTSVTTPVTATELLPILPPSSAGDRVLVPESSSRLFMEILLEHMVSTVVRLEWQDKGAHHHRCFHFLLERFKVHYLPRICAEFDYGTSLYRPNLELPVLRKPEPESELVSCRVSLIKWVAGHMHQMKKGTSDAGSGGGGNSIVSGSGTSGGGGGGMGIGGPLTGGGPMSIISTNSTHSHMSTQEDELQQESAPQSLESNLIIEDPNYESIVLFTLYIKEIASQERHKRLRTIIFKIIDISVAKSPTDEALAAQIVRDVFCSTRENVNFVHELYRQAFLLTFNHTVAIRKTIAVYKDIIQVNMIDVPPYVQEPLDDLSRLPDDQNSDGFRSTRLRNDSYLGAIHKENLLVRAGLQNTLQIFTTHAANVFLLEAAPNVTALEEQTDTCKRVLNIYRYMVMHNRMDNCTWEQLLLVLLQITSLVLGSQRPSKKTLGEKLAQPIFQTLIVTWIKANLNVVIARELWDRFLHVLTALTNWADLIKEWAKTMETLTRVLARHVYNLDLTNLPLDRLAESKSKRVVRRTANMASGHNSPSASGGANNNNASLGGMDGHPMGGVGLMSGGDGHRGVIGGVGGNGEMQRGGLDDDGGCQRQNSLIGSRGGGDGRHGGKLNEGMLARSLSETNLARKRLARASTRHRRFHSLDNLRANTADSESTDRTRSPSPAPSNGLETNSIKDSPIQLDDAVGASHHHQLMTMSPQLGSHGVQLHGGGDEQHRGIVCGGAVRGWLPDVAVILWRRMLGALGDVNEIKDARLHAQVFDYLVKLTDALIKIKLNQGISADNITTPVAPELVPPLTYILPWCFGALNLPGNFEQGKLSALRLLCTVTLNCDSQHRSYLPHFYRSLHIALSGTSRPTLNTAIRYLGPRFLSLQLPGASLLLLDQIHACNTVLNSSDMSPATPRTEAVSILGNLLAYSDDLRQISVLQPDDGFQVMPCPDVKEHVVSILLRTGRHEPTGMARCVAISSLGLFVYRELTNQTYHSKVVDAMNIILLALKFNNKVVAQLASNTLFLLCDHAAVLWSQYPRLADSVIRALCGALFLHFPLGSIAGQTDRALETALLLCLGEWCMRLGPTRLLEISEYGEPRGSCLLLLVFNVLFKLIRGRSAFEDSISGGLTQPSIQDDFDPNILLDNIDRSHANQSPSRNQNCQQGITLCARTVLSHLVTHLGHFPMAIGAARLSSLVVEHDDVPELNSDELSANIFSAPNIQLFVLTRSVIASLVELPTLELPGGGVTAGLSTADRQVRVLMRDLSGKASWDASILYRTPTRSSIDSASLHSSQNTTLSTLASAGNGNATPGGNNNTSVTPATSEGSVATARWGPMSMFQPESLMVSGVAQPHLQQRAMRHRPPTVLPVVGNAAPDLDQLDDLLQYLGHTSPECLDHFERKLNEPTPLIGSSELEAEAIASVISERNMEVEQTKQTSHMDAMLSQPASRPHSRASTVTTSRDFADTSVSSQYSGSTTTMVEQSQFQQCRLLFSQLGLAGWDRRKQLYLLNKTDRLLRELRNLDLQRCRETHKVALIYVAPGQEDKTSILSNQGGSAAYEQFLAALAWEVELEGHTGFLGGLQRQGSTGLTAPYFATSFLEAIFHVATRMPGDTPEAVLNKTRHLGNDEVHVVWSEHSRDYRRDIIPTEFCDILIIIYPLGNHLNRVTVNCKPDVPYFGVLFDEAIVESNILAGMVRAAVICASRAKRTTLSFYQQYYEERARSLDTVVTSNRDDTTFENFIARVYSPVATASPFYSGGGMGVTGGAGDGISGGGGGGAAPSKLAAALLDSAHGHSRPRAAQRERSDLQHRRSEGIHETTSRGIWFTNPAISQNIESVFSISPRPIRKLTHMKGIPRKSTKQQEDTPTHSSARN